MKKLAVTPSEYEHIESLLSAALRDYTVTPELSEDQKDAVWEAFFREIVER